MAVPKFKEFMRPLLEALAVDGAETNMKQVAPQVAARMQLSENDLAETMRSGQSVFYNRLYWAKQHLAGADAVEACRRGYFRINARGRMLLRDSSGAITNDTLREFPEFVAWYRRNYPGAQAMRGDDIVRGAVQAMVTDGGVSPQEQAEAAQRLVDADVRGELLARFRAASPAFFERVVIDLLQAMGFASRIGARSFVTGKSGDGGIDGIVHQDALGLDAIYVQAKRYAEGNGVGRPAIQGFIGSMVGFRAAKGVFVTTSHFSAEAKDYLGKVQQRVVLIDGEQLAELALAYNIGTRVQSTIALKAIDEAYFEDDIGIAVS